MKKFGDRYQSLFKVTLLVFNFFICVAFFEKFFGNVQFFVQLKTILVPNGWWGEIGLGRGISLLSTEPSRAAIEVAIVYSLLWFYYKRYRAYLTLTFIALELLLIKSMTGAIFCMIAILAAYPVMFLSMSFIVMYYFLNIHDNQIFEIRWLAIVKDVLDASNWEAVLDIFLALSGNRIISLVASVKTILTYPLGLGIGGSTIAADQIYEMIDLREKINVFQHKNFNGDYNLKSSSFFSSLLMEVGILSLTFLFVYIRFIIKSLNNARNGIVLPISVITFSLLFIGPAGSPIPFACLGLLVLHNRAEGGATK
ncbi:hypothetical protein OAS88_00925 [Planktomarina temperata]|nr:hypothetical protein [Planktomarina temperata]MDC1094167.1 hypothetical protein [Planktomarina temperata]